MSHFVKYIENRHLTPLYEQAAELISLDIPLSIRYCESRVTNHSFGKIYEIIARELRNFNEVDYGAAFAANAAQQKANKAIADARAQAADAARAAQEDKLRKDKQAEEEKLKADAEAAAGRTYSAAAPDLVAMLKHIGVNLQALHKSGHISHDYAQAIQTMIMDLKTSVRRYNDPKDPAELSKLLADRRSEAAKKQAIVSSEFKKNSAIAKEIGDMMEIVKTLRSNGLPNKVSDYEAGAIYKQLYSLLKNVHEAGHSPRKALQWWLKNDEFGDDHATDQQRFVMAAVLKLGETQKYLPQPGVHKHIEPESKPEPKDINYNDDSEKYEDPPASLSDEKKDDDDDDLMKNDEDEDYGDFVSKGQKKSESFQKIFDLNKLAGLNIPVEEEKNALQIAVKSAITNSTMIEPIKEPLNRVLNYLMHRFNEAKTNSSGPLNKGKITRMITKFFNGESNNPNMITLIEKIRKGMDGKNYEDLKKIIIHVMNNMNVKENNEQIDTNNNCINLQEQQRYSIMLKTLAGIRN